MIGVASATSFRWRHRFPALSKDDRPQRPGGIAEADGVGARIVQGREALDGQRIAGPDAFLRAALGRFNT